MDEYVKICFPRRRRVWVDGKFCGFTNRTFQVETGSHTFDLGPTANYTPEQHKCMVKETLPEDPKIIEFELVRNE